MCLFAFFFIIMYWQDHRLEVITARWFRNKQNSEKDNSQYDPHLGTCEALHLPVQ